MKCIDELLSIKKVSSECECTIVLGTKQLQRLCPALLVRSHRSIAWELPVSNNSTTQYKYQ